MKSVTPLMVKLGRQSLEKGLLCIFQAVSIILFLLDETKVQSLHG